MRVVEIVDVEEEELVCELLSEEECSSNEEWQKLELRNNNDTKKYFFIL
jgi:hypothetical protein